MSERYFAARLAGMGVKPRLLTTQLMYPGAFILRDTLPAWSTGQANDALRTLAAAAYARNQKIKQGAAAGVFANLK